MGNSVRKQPSIFNQKISKKKISYIQKVRNQKNCGFDSNTENWKTEKF